MNMSMVACVDEKRQCMRKGKRTCGTSGSYLGSRNLTVTGRQCQRWSSQTPHAHSFGSTHGDHNFCRVDGVLGPWCLTTDPSVKWEYCFKSCPDCVVDKRDCALRGQAICRQEDGYQGTKERTVSGKRCQRWSAQTPHVHSFAAVGNHSRCRISGANAPWCFTTDPDTRWEYCYRPCNVYDVQNRDTSIDEDFGTSIKESKTKPKRPKPVSSAAKISSSTSIKSPWRVASRSDTASVTNSPTVNFKEFSPPILHPDGEGELLAFCDKYDPHHPFICKVLGAQALCQSEGFAYVKSYRRAFDRKRSTKSWTRSVVCSPQFSALGGCWRYSAIRCSKTLDGEDAKAKRDN